ncbi:UDP-2,3-diacylglucosamine diphosphatase [Chitinivibrio alkaliphilus]|uniref:UDP-2,3-diacylglucosamine hydrolase n=1 Tax=Chitinivibrio alkaliphilus ACht1 TaxID=1313304 RepID=U7D5K6_9BACT|nr:UDP-2,3-diacylglucosamine diphosphatase [Chitinivibrio alkaliphilus]ERP31814.1 UDP-2,3-diacylglucosamine hydrolase [Chitinivibrio alkaliphilus ACht1]
MIRFFISDQHFGASFVRDEAERRSVFLHFCTYLRTLPGAELYILGDFFDFWIERAGKPRRTYLPLLSAMKELIKDGVSVTYLQGNHDFMPMSFLERMGVRIVTEQTFHHAGKCVHLEHGHRIRKGTKRGVLYGITENRVLQQLYKMLPLCISVPLAEGAAHLSRKKGVAAHHPHKYERYRGCIENVMGQRGYDLCILGHLHVCSVETVSTGVYANCGTWMEEGEYPLLYLQDTTLILSRLCPDGTPQEPIKTVSL